MKMNILLKLINDLISDGIYLHEVIETETHLKLFFDVDTVINKSNLTTILNHPNFLCISSEKIFNKDNESESFDHHLCLTFSF